MKKLFKNYKGGIILLSSLILGGIIGLIFKEKILFLKPFGDLFLNLLLVIIVPLVFFTISSSIGKMNHPKRIGKILTSIVITIILTSLVSVLIGLISTNTFKLVDVNNGNFIKESLKGDNNTAIPEKVNYLEKTVQTISVDNFEKLLSRENMIALILFSILFGIAVNMSKDKGKPVLDVLESATEVIQKFIKIIMYYAPIGLGCYFATLIGSFGKDIAIGYGKTFIIYLITAILFYFIFYSFYGLLSAGKKGVVSFWKNIIPTTLTALGTCSSAATIPVSIAASKRIGVPNDIADTTIPLGTNFHKDGSIIGSVFKIMFLVYLFNSDISAGKILGIALIATLLVSAVPIGGGTISEMLIITMLGFPIAALPILTIIATIIDAPATVLNAVGNTSASMIVARLVDGKNWLKEKVRN